MSPPSASRVAKLLWFSPSERIPLSLALVVVQFIRDNPELRERLEE
jgi:hypothetical protein